MRSWLKGLFSEPCGKPSIRRTAFGIVIAAGIVRCFISPWHDISENEKHIGIALIAAASSAAGLGRFAEQRGEE
jgi:hypothetical protein